MSPANRHKYKYIHSTVKDRRQKFHFCRLPFDVRPRINVNLNLSTNYFEPTKWRPCSQANRKSEEANQLLCRLCLLRTARAY